MSELALRLIAENKRTRATFLDLGNCGLAEVPEELGELVWLEELSFADEWWEQGGWKPSPNSGPGNTLLRLVPKGAFNPFSRLANLKWLRLSGSPQQKPELADLAPLAGLAGLRSLDISRTGVADLSPLSGLAGLQSLYVSRTGVADLSPLSGLAGLQSLFVSGTKVADLSPLVGLVGLQSLYVWSTPVADLTPLTGLAGLQWLDVSSTQVADLTPLAGLVGLQSLAVSSTQVADLTPLAGLAGLRRLDVSHTPVADLTPLAGLAGLQWLDVSSTQVADLFPLLLLIRQDLPVKWSSKKWISEREEDNGIYVEDCPLTNPPAEVVQQGNEAILNYCREKTAQGVDHLYEAKLLIVGEGGAGKTSLLRRLYRPELDLPEECDTTKGIDIHRQHFKLADGRDFRLNVWDFGGQEIYHATHQFFLTKRSLYVLLDDTRKDHKTVQDEGFKNWLEAVDHFSDRSPVLIFQNEKGGRGKTIDEAGIKARFNLQEVHRGNLEHKGAADKLREALEYHACTLPHIGDELPARWMDIRAEIEASAQQVPYIRLEEYFDLYAKHLEFDRTKALHLSRYFHDLGVFLHFQDDPLLARTVILQNEWATEAVFKMLDDETVKRAWGRFAAADCARVWRDSVYADMHPELLALMQNFELCYRLPDTRPETWLVSQLLPPSKPAELDGWAQPGDLALRYRYEFLPKGMISRLIVRQHRYVPRPELGWITGALFERDGTALLVEIPPKGGEIVLRARGPERKELLSVIAADLDALNDSFHGLRDRVGKWVPCCCEKCAASTEPFFFEQKVLLQFRADGVLKWKCSRSYADVDVLQLLDGLRLQPLAGWPEGDKASGHLREERDRLENLLKLEMSRPINNRAEANAMNDHSRKIENSPISHSAVNLGDHTQVTNTVRTGAEVSELESLLGRLREAIGAATLPEADKSAALEKVDVLRQAADQPEPQRGKSVLKALGVLESLGKAAGGLGTLLGAVEKWFGI